MRSDSFEPEEIRTNWIEGSPEVLRERLTHKEREILQQKQEIRKIRADLNKQMVSLSQTIMLLNQTMKDLKESGALLELEKEKNRRLEEVLGKKNNEINELSGFRTRYELEREKNKHLLEEEMHQKENEVKKKGPASKYQALFSSLLFLLASLLASFGANLLTLTPPDPKGIILISFAVMIYLLAAVMTVFILGGSN